MMKWVIACARAWLMCITGFVFIWVVGIYVECIFWPGCFYKITFLDVLRMVDYKSVMIKGTLSAAAIVGVALSRRC